MRSPIRLMLVLAASLALGACKQGEGERCQIKADCEEGLVCAGDGFCRNELGPVADATPATPDATPPTPDAAP